MSSAINRLKTEYRENPSWVWLLFVLFLFPILPEYISPFILFAGYIVFKKHWSSLGNKALLGDIGKSIFVYTIFMVFSGIWSNTHIFSSLVGMLWMGCFLMYAYCANAINSVKKLKLAITIINISSGIIGIIAIVEFISFSISLLADNPALRFPNPLYFDINTAFFERLPFEVVYKRYSSRASATFDNPLILATYLIITTPFCAFGSIFFEHSKNRKISRTCWVFSLAGIVATTSRGAYIAIGLALIIILLSLTKNRNLFKKILPFIIIMAVAIPIGLVIRYKNSSTDFLSSNTNRFDVWTGCFSIITSNVKNAMIGVGAGTENIHTLLRDIYHIDRTHAHNLFLEILTEGGLIGTALFVWMFVLTAKELYNISKSSNKSFTKYSVLYISSLIGFLTMSLFEHTLQSPKELMCFFMLFGVIDATRRIANNEIQATPDVDTEYTFKYEQEEIKETVDIA